nr:unnamed protein product [Digitaria exilis]
MQSSTTDRRRGGGPVATASGPVWRPRSSAPAAGPDAAAAPILPLPTPAASESRPPHRRPRRPNHGNNQNRRPAPPQEQQHDGAAQPPRSAPHQEQQNNNAGRHRRPGPHQEHNDNAGHHRRGPPLERPAPARERAPPTAAAAPIRGDGSVPQLVQEIQDKLARGAVECMICYDMVRRSAPIWSCDSCFSIFHLPCIRKWARSPASAADASPAADPANPSWRCPGCQSVYNTPARDLAYTCFCGRRREPPNDHYLTPHSCGEPCSKPLERAEPLGAKGEDADATRCPHVCVLQCHPGPCPPCKAFAPDRPCPCGKQIIVRRCADRSTPVTCGRPCERMLPCKRHRCEKVCHTGPCGDCSVLISARCFCGKKNETLLCGDMVVKGKLSEDDGVFSCSELCGHTLSCGNHVCKDMCHPGPCGECELMPGKVTTCHCGKTRLQERRASCLDPVPTCDKICDKKLPCGVHSCKVNCHEGECPPCLARIEQKCRCGSSGRMVECYQVKKEEFRCNKPCGRKKNCGRHRCSECCCPLSRKFAQLEGVAILLLVISHQQMGMLAQALEAELLVDRYVVLLGENPVESNGKRVPLGQRKLSCDDECAKMEKKRVLAEAFDITPPNLDALHFGENSSASDLVSDLFRRDPKWVLAIEERCKFLVLGKVRGSSSSNLKLHVFCPMLKDKRDAIRLIADRWKLSVQAAGWEPKRFITIHVTPKSKPPARILGSKAGAPVTAAHPYFDPLVDMDPRLVVAMLDLPRDADVNALVLRFGGECELVWLNDKNAIAVFNDPARAATALRRLDYGSAYQGAAMFMPSSAQTSSGNVWVGGQKDGGLAARSNPWKKPAAAEADLPSGDWTGVAGHAPAAGWRGASTASQVMGTQNRWNVLESDAATSSGPAEDRKTAPRTDAGYSAVQNSGNAGSSVSKLQPDVEVDNWEEACE